ncbi:hypothetical protein D3C87_1942250 [compost metagenome]
MAISCGIAIPLAMHSCNTPTARSSLVQRIASILAYICRASVIIPVPIDTDETLFGAMRPTASPALLIASQ